MSSIRCATLIYLALLVSACEKEKNDFMVGTLERDRIELRAETNEPITAIEVADGTSVKPGELILTQDSRRQNALLLKTQSERDQIKARLDELLRGPRGETIRKSRAQLEASKVAESNALADFERAQSIFDRGLSNQAELDHARARWESSQARSKADFEALSTLLNGTTPEELRQVEAALAAAEAQAAFIQISVERQDLRAPVAGVIDKILVELGERPPAGSTLAILLASARSYARVYVPQHLRSRISAGDRLEIRVDGVNHPLEGRVRWVSADASFTPYFALTEHDRSRLSYLAEIDLSDAGHLPTGLPLQAIMVP